MKKICFNGLKKVLSEKEMKNVLGGSDDDYDGSCHCTDGGNHPFAACMTSNDACAKHYGTSCYCKAK